MVGSCPPYSVSQPRGVSGWYSAWTVGYRFRVKAVARVQATRATASDEKRLSASHGKRMPLKEWVDLLEERVRLGAERSLVQIQSPRSLKPTP
jgi:hypothetical protein